MNYNMNNTQTATNTDNLKKWYIQKFESIFGDFPEVEKAIMQSCSLAIASICLEKTFSKP